MSTRNTIDHEQLLKILKSAKYQSQEQFKNPSRTDRIINIILKRKIPAKEEENSDKVKILDRFFTEPFRINGKPVHVMETLAITITFLDDASDIAHSNLIQLPAI